MSQKVEFEFTGTDKGLASMLLRMQRDIGRVGQQVVGMEGRFNSGFQSMQKMGGSNLFSGTARQLAGIAAGALSAQAILAKMIATGREFSEEGLNASRQWDQLFREFGGQSGLRAQALDFAEKKIKKIGQEVGLDLQNTAQAATQMVSSGFSAEEASGESLRQLLRGFIGSNLAGRQVQMQDLAQATANYLSAQGLEKNAANVEDVMSRVQALYKGTNLQFQDFAEFARESASMAGIVTVGEQMASLATLRDVMTAEEASTGMRNLVGRMRTAGGSSEKLEGLQLLGLKKEEVDMVGEDFMTALRRLADAINQTAPEIRPIALKKIFEERGVAFAEILTRNLDLIDERIKTQIEGKKQFQEDVKFASEGVNSAARRQENNRLELMAKSGKDRNELLFNEARQFLYEKGYSPFRVETSIGIEKVLTYLGFNADNAASRAVDMEPHGPEIVQKRLQERLKPTGKPDSKIESEIKAPAPKIPTFTPEQAAYWEERRKIYSNPRARGRRSTLNPWYDRPGRYPKENSAILAAERLEREMAGQFDAFGSLLPEQEEDLKKRIGLMQQGTAFLGNNVHTYDLQKKLRSMTGVLERERTNRAAAGLTSEAEQIQREMAGQFDAFGSLLPEQSKRFSDRLAGIESRADPQGNLELKQLLTRLADAIDRNTSATNGNTNATNGDDDPPSRPRPHRPVTVDQQRTPAGGL